MTSRPFFRTNAIADVMLLELCGEISSLADHTVLHELEEIRQRRRETGLTKLIVDLGQAPFFGSSLLELIRVLWKDLSAESGKLVLCNPSPVGREVLQVAKFDRLWPLVETRAEALSLLDSARDVERWPLKLQESLAQYEAGPETLRVSLEGLSAMELRTSAPPGAWSALQIVCHIADFELVYADRMKRVVAENQPQLPSGDPDLFAEKLAYSRRDIDDELDLITAVRREVSRLLKTLNPDEFERTGIHSTDGPLTLAQLLERIGGHIPHHVTFIEGKKTTLKARQPNSRRE